MPKLSGRPASALAAMLALACAACAGPSAPRAQGVPRYVLDASFPAPLPNLWVLGGLGGVCVDHNDHVFILNRQDVADGDLNGGRLAPMLIEFDAAGKVVNSWGDHQVTDARLHSCHEDGEGNLWVAAAPSGMVQKFSHDGSRLLLTIGAKGALDTADGTAKGAPLNTAGARFTSPSSIAVDRGNGDVYVSDGESPKQNKRVAVFDRSGKFLRQWLLPHMQSVHCLALSRAGEVYVCNRTGSQVEIYDKQGKLLRALATPWQPVTAPANGQARETGGSAVSVDFSPDAAQKWLYVMNQNNARVDIYERASGKWLTSFGRPGTFAGEFNQAHGIAVDSQGRVYVSENRGRRIMRYVLAN
jgi:sugar lactone lactonase YvrE